jgi:hypothetical protein
VTIIDDRQQRLPTVAWPPSGDTARPKPHQGRRACRGNEAERGIIRAQPLFHKDILLL